MLTKAQGELKDNDEDESSDSDSEDSEPYGESDNEKEEGNQSDDDLIEDENNDSKSVDDDDLGFVDKKPGAASTEYMEETKDQPNLKSNKKKNNDEHVFGDSDNDEFDDMVSFLKFINSFS